MDQRYASTRRTRRLSVRISFFLILAAILPLFIALVFSEVQTRATLINQADRTLAADQNSIYFVANQQLLITLLVALLVLIPLGLLGWLVGSSIAYPISRSVESLEVSSSALNRLSENEKRIASEQIWMMDSSETGLESIQYYTDASKKAIHQLNTLGNDLLARPEREKVAILNGVAQMLYIGRYFEKAISHQNERNRQVAVAMKTTREVAKQIESGAKSVDNATTVLDQVVYQLRRIIGN